MLKRLLCLLLLTAGLAAAQDPQYATLSDFRNHNDRWVERQNAGQMLFRRLNERAFALIEERDREIAAIRTAAGWEERRDEVRARLNELLGPWPEKTPLNARVTGVIERERYRIEKLVYESQPGFHVTAALYVPKDPGPHPGILYIPGHADIGLRASHYQNACLNLVQKGFVVLNYDPVDQGERMQQIDPGTGEPWVTPRDVPHFKIHSYFGNQCLLAGVSPARYFIWDAIRGIDYLTSRPEVDPSRIGVTGNSGGGNMTVFTAAVDDRVTVAVPSCFVTSYKRMLALNGIQDSEQNLYHGLKYGIEHAEWLLARAPKPTLLLTTTHDFFPIQGARETEAELNRVYEAMGKPDNFDRVEDDHGHGYTRKTSEASYAFLMKHLAVPGDPSEESYAAPTPEDLKVSDTGQVLTTFRGETVFDFNRQEAERLLAQLEQERAGVGYLAQAVEQARALSGYEAPEADDDVIYRGGFQLDGYRIEKYTLDAGPNAVVPALLALPEGDGPHPVVVGLHPDGKEADLPTVGELARAGYAVAVPDLIGIGETKPAIGRQNDINAPYYEGALVGSSVVGLQANDLTRVVAWLQTDDRLDAASIGVIALGALGPTAIHAAAFHPEIRWLALDGALATYASVVMNRYYTTPTESMVPGALTAYDLPDLVAAIAPRRVVISGPRDQAGEPLSEAEARRAYGYAISQYESVGAGSHLRVMEDAPGVVEIVKWCME